MPYIAELAGPYLGAKSISRSGRTAAQARNRVLAAIVLDPDWRSDVLPFHDILGIASECRVGYSTTDHLRRFTYGLHRA